jgi:26S proteasome regulatory subunit N2
LVLHQVLTLPIQDDKLDVKPDGDVDVEMKNDETSPKDGDVSPITQSVVNLGDETKASSSRIGKKTEPAFEVRPNFSRVTPTQLAYISFPANGRYQPVRAVSAKTSPTKAGKAAAASGRHIPPSTLALGSEKYAGGGGILIMSDLRPNEEAEFIEIETASTLAAPQVVVAPMDAMEDQPTRSLNISLDDAAPESDVPEAFEVCPIFLIS